MQLIGLHGLGAVVGSVSLRNGPAGTTDRHPTRVEWIDCHAVASRLPVPSKLSGPTAIGALLQASHVGRVDVEATVSGLDARPCRLLGRGAQYGRGGMTVSMPSKEASAVLRAAGQGRMHARRPVRPSSCPPSRSAPETALGAAGRGTRQGRHGHAQGADGRCGQVAQRGWPRLVGVLLACVLVAACTSAADRRSTATSQLRPPGLARRDYWPTSGWRTAAPAAQGMDPAVLDQLDTKVPAYHSQVRSLLVVRHGYLVYEHYWQGFAASDGHDVRSVTKSVTSALVGIALGEGKLKGLDQTVGELLARHLPKDADPRLARVTVEQLLTMTSGLPGDDPSIGGDWSLMDRLIHSRDWVRHILSRRLAANPGTSFAYSNATSHLLSAIVADATGQSTLEFARARLFGPLGISSAKAPEPVFVPHPSQAVVKAYEQAPVAWPTDPQGYHLGSATSSCPLATWPSSATCTSTAAAGTPPRCSQPTTWPTPPARTAPHPLMRPPRPTATSGG
jgi:CubicO group peptidase (beta-lactamase class C family)